MQTNTMNPYASPQEAGPSAPDRPGESTVDDPPFWLRTVGRWTLICAVSAAPSFFLGLGVSNHSLAIPAMILGIAIFTAGYSIAVRTPTIRRLMTSKPICNSIRIAFTTRIIASIVAPLGMMNDMVVGSASLSMTTAIASVADGINGYGQLGPVVVLLTTVVQGLFLNIEIYVFAVLVYGIALLAGAGAKPVG